MNIVAPLMASAKSVGKAIVKHKPEIFIGLGITGMTTAGVWAVSATPKAVIKIDQKKDELNTDKLPPVEIIKTAWKCYAPAVVLAALSATCIIGGCHVSLRRNAALAAAYTISEERLRDYMQSTLNEVGPDVERGIRDDAARAKAERTEGVRNVILHGEGDIVCLDAVSGRYFKSCKNRIEAAVNQINNKLNTRDEATLNDFYDYLDSPDLDHISIGEDLGWHIDRGLLQIRYTSGISKDGLPVLILNYGVAPCYFR